MREVMPLLRVEGVIDAHGLDMGVLSAMPSHIYELHKQRLDMLNAPEVELKARQQGQMPTAAGLDHPARECAWILLGGGQGLIWIFSHGFFANSICGA